jgi:hypothetical protein
MDVLAGLHTCGQVINVHWQIPVNREEEATLLSVEGAVGNTMGDGGPLGPSSRTCGLTVSHDLGHRSDHRR